jgi:cytochrome c-type biogenesis protein CcmH/NrfG
LYAQSWALVHYLTLGNQARSAQFRKYLSAIRAGTPDDEAFAAAFGADTATLDRELFEYVRQFSFPAIRLDFPEKSASTSVPRGRTLDDDEADAYLADMQARVDRVEEARARVAAIQKRDPKVGRASMVLGTLDLRENRLSEALGHLEKAAALAPDDHIVQSAYGRGLVMQMSRGRTDPEGAAAILTRARQALRRATTLDPRSARAAYMLAYAELVGGGDVAAAITALERAVKLDPTQEEFRMLLAQAFLRQGEYDKATAIVGPLMAAGRTSEIRAEARRILTDLGNIRAARAAGAAAPPIGAPVPASLVALPLPVPPGGTAAPIDAVRLAEIRSEAERASGLLLRQVQAGERRVLGTFQAIDCVNGSVVLRVSSEGRSLALRAKALADVDFISYRSSTPGEVNCGPQKAPERVYATYRPAAEGGVDGEAVAIEVLPDNFAPAEVPR